MIWLIPLVYGSFFLNTAFSQEDSKLLFLHTVTRHGDRTPTGLYPTSPNLEFWQREGLGKLTLLGRKQHYALGKYLRSRYWDFITTNPDEVLVNSSSVERCLVGAMATIASFYAPEGRWKCDDDLHQIPIPIHYQPPDRDKHLNFICPCPRAYSEMLRHRYSEEMQEFFQKHQAEIDAISNHSGLNIIQDKFFYLYDTLRIEKQNNLPTPEWADLYWDLIKETSDMIYPTRKLSVGALRLRAGPLLQDISQNMKKKIDGELPNRKVQMYFTHDVIIASTLRALNFTNVPHPPYCATLLFELHEMNNSSKAVRTLYLNATDPIDNVREPHVMELNGCSEFCPLENFTNIIQHLIPEDWEQECQTEDTTEPPTDSTNENSV